MSFRRNEYCPIHRSLILAGAESAFGRTRSNFKDVHSELRIRAESRQPCRKLFVLKAVALVNVAPISRMCLTRRASG
jgi:hypothetical protein